MKILWPILFLALSGCDVLGIGQACSDIGVPAIAVAVEDSATGGSATADGDITVTASDGDFEESAQLPSNAGPSEQVFLVFERPGTYRVEVQASGYRLWVAEAVRVTEDRCDHPRTVDLRARLQRVSED